MGRNRIQIEKIVCPMKRRTTLAKRSRGLLKKAKELAVLCDVGVGLVIISSTGKPQIFSNRPSIEQFLQQFHENTQEGNEAGMCSDHKEECRGGCCQSHLSEQEDPSLSLQQIGTGQVYCTSCTMEPEDPSLSVQQIGTGQVYCTSGTMEPEDPSLSLKQNETGQVYCTSGTNPPPGMQSTHCQIPIQHPQVWGREQLQMQPVPFVEMENPSSIQRSVPMLFGSSGVSGPYEASDYMRGPLVGRSEMPFCSGEQPSAEFHLPGGESGNLKHFSNQRSIEQSLQRFHENTQEGNEAGMCSGHKEECKGGCRQSHLLEPEDPSLSLQQIGTGQGFCTSGSNPSPGVQSTYYQIPIQHPRVWGREQMQMQPVPFVEMGNPSSIRRSVPMQFGQSEVNGPYNASDYIRGPLVGRREMPFCSDEQPSAEFHLPGGESCNLEHFSNQPRIEQVPKQLNQNIISNMPEEEMANL